ncbi:MAG: NVEALA domain-containing protein [Prevotellaceae bacterium]|jgi:hypothetical protein|nr:NVEALA domain-containing protein [Prevotellaceae bacterium]
MNKKKIFGFSAALVIVAIATFNMNVNSLDNVLSDISLANVEALAFETEPLPPNGVNLDWHIDCYGNIIKVCYGDGMFPPC